MGTKSEVHYNGSEAYKPKVGTFINLGKFVLVAINTLNLVVDYTEIVNAQEKTLRGACYSSSTWSLKIC